jgi:beta-glucanase (GH16 family)
MRPRLIPPCAIVLLALPGCMSSPDTTTARSTPAALPGWELVWADEFDAPRIDTGNWTALVMPDPYNEELQYYTDRIDDTPGANAFIDDGVLVIEAREERYEHRRYTSARLNTKGKKEFLYGRFEARMKLPDGVAMWPAFWLLGGNIDTVPWPLCGEIDIMEGKGRVPTQTSGAVHRGPDGPTRKIDVMDYTLPEGNLHDSWHVFAVEWEADQVRWYLDDVNFFTLDKPPGVTREYWPLDHGHSYYIILNLAVGGIFDEPYLPPPDMAPQHLYVDYVRVYRKAPSATR